MLRLADRMTEIMGRIPHATIGLLARLSMGWIFWTAGRVRMGGSWNVLEPRGNTMAMFRGGYDIPHVPSELAAIAVQVAELVLPVLLAVGLASRFAALGLLVLIAVFELFVQPGPYAVHAAWAAILLTIVKYGPGSISLDHAWGRG